jgi:heme/copper-type cytochrome/quinol oxidase subunit 3
MTGFHGCHVLSGVIYLGVWWVKNKLGKELPNAELVEAAGLFWHFVDLVWVFIFTFVYLIPPIPRAG